MKIFISVGDASADLHAAKLISAIKQNAPATQFVGLGGPEMEKTGFRSIIPLERISVIGFWEVAKRFNTFLNLKKNCRSILKSEQIDAMIAIDYPGFNIGLAASAKELGIPVIYYIAPQLWAWGENRAKKLAAVTDKLYVVFPFEEEYFRKFGIDTEFVGHPLLDNQIFRSEFVPFSQKEKRILMLPGSRSQEIHRHLPVLLETAETLKKELPDYSFTIAKSNSIGINEITSFLPRNSFIEVRENTRELMRTSMAGIVKSGTSNLEAALLGMPLVLVYIISQMTYLIGKKIINLDWISIVNILQSKEVVKEFIQNDANPASISAEILSILRDGEKTERMISEFHDIKKMLGGGGASKNVADKLLNFLKK